MAIVHNLLILTWPTDRPNCSVDESSTVIKSMAFIMSCHCTFGKSSRCNHFAENWIGCAQIVCICTSGQCVQLSKFQVCFCQILGSCHYTDKYRQAAAKVYTILHLQSRSSISTNKFRGQAKLCLRRGNLNGHKSSTTSSASFELRWGSLELALELALDLNLQQ